MMAGTKITATLGLLLLASVATPPAERIVTGDGIVAMTINGASGRVRIDPAALAMPLVTTGFAERAGLKKGMFAVGYAVGPERVRGATDVGRIDFGAGPVKRRIGWTERPYTAAADGAVGPGGLPDPIVRFVLRGPVAGERVVALPMVEQGGLGGGWGSQFARINIGGQPMRVRFDPHHARTLATAGAGARIAEVHGGRLTGEVEKAEIVFGIERPIRSMTLAQPIVVAGLPIASLGVRTADFGSAAGIADANAPAPDPDEIVVTARGKRDPDRDRLSIGADQLARCSSIVFDKPAKQIRLTCA